MGFNYSRHIIAMDDDDLEAFVFAQFLILENVDPPSVTGVTEIAFTGEMGNGRFGLFPPI